MVYDNEIATIDEKGEKMDKIDWLEPWGSVNSDPDYFEKELYNEVGKNHILYGKKVSAIGRRYDCDDILFQVFDSKFIYVVVHLTFTRKTEDSIQYPKTTTYKDLNSWINECMIPVHSEYVLDEE